MKKLFIITLLFSLSFISNAQITHRFDYAKDFVLENSVLSIDSLSKTYTINVVIWDKEIRQHFGVGVMEDVKTYKFVVLDGKTKKQEKEIAIDSLNAFVNRIRPNF